MKKPTVRKEFHVAIESQGEIEGLQSFLEARLWSLENGGGRVTYVEAREMAFTTPAKKLLDVGYQGRDVLRHEMPSITPVLQADIAEQMEGNGHSKDNEPMLVNMDAINRIAEETLTDNRSTSK